jgi:hypothetical protein
MGGFLLYQGGVSVAESVWTRQYLKNLGYNDEDIDYNNGAVTLKNKPFFYTNPNEEGKAVGSQNDLDAAYRAYQSANTANQMQTNLTNRQNQTNNLLSQYTAAVTKKPKAFTYDINSIKADPLYTSALTSYTDDTNRGTNQALVNLGRRGIGNSQSAVTAELAGQKSINDYANTKLAPQVIGQKYQQYQDMVAQQDRQNANLLGLANVYDRMGQQELDNLNRDRSFERNVLESDRNFDRALGRDARSDFESDRGFNRQLERDTRGDFVQDRAYDRGVLESDRGYDRGILESDRNFNRQLGRDTRSDFESDRGYGLQFNAQALSAANSRADNARADEAAKLNRERFDYEKDPKNPDNQYKMAQIGKQQQSTQQVPAKDSANNLSEAKRQIPTTASYEQAMLYANAIAPNLSDADYKSFLKWIDDEFGG